jgi:hypothetical protein
MKAKRIKRIAVGGASRWNVITISDAACRLARTCARSPKSTSKLNRRYQNRYSTPPDVFSCTLIPATASLLFAAHGWHLTHGRRRRFGLQA